MAIPIDVELVLITAICGLIGISVYVLYLVDKLLSRIESLEGTINNSQASQSKQEDLETLLKQTTSGFSTQIKEVNEVLESTGKDIDSLNAKITSFLEDLSLTRGQLINVEKKVSEDSKEAIAIRRDLEVVVRNLEQLEKETEMLLTRQQLTEEF